VLLAYNLGIRGIKDSVVIKLINEPKAVTKFANLEEAWKANNTSFGVIVRGLVRRRKSEWNIYTRGLYENW
jgi:type VI secretion system secreted protein VgrG